MHTKHRKVGLPVLSACVALSACADAEPVGSHQGALAAECAVPEEIPEDAWQCTEPRTVECGAEQDEVLYVPEDTVDCEGELSVSAPHPRSPGQYEVVVSNEAGESLCSAPLTVIDEQPPELSSHTLELWPPNHKVHEIAVSDCVSAVDACDGELEGEFIWASSDEPIDDIGDGHFGPDIELAADARHACVRAERQGPRDGRVYRLGVQVTDAAGNVAEGECVVIVDHDQRGTPGMDSGEAYRVELDPSQASGDCGPAVPPAQDEPDGGTDDPGEPVDAGAGEEDAGVDEPDDAGDVTAI